MKNLRQKYSLPKIGMNLFFKSLKRFLFALFKILVPLTKRNGKQVLVFYSTPDYSDNSRALSDYLVKSGYLGCCEIYWCVSNPKIFKKKYPESDVEFVSSVNDFNDFSLKTYWVFAKTDYFFGTHGFPIVEHMMIPKQKKILLWHGCSFKDASPNAKRNFFDEALVAGPIFKKTKAKYWNTSEDKLIAKGYPRYDWLLKKNAEAEKFFCRFKDGFDKVVVWMPTFRNDKNGKFNECGTISHFPLIKCSDDWFDVDELCGKYNILLLVKLHVFQKEYGIDFSRLKNIKQIDNDFFVSNGVQMYEFLALTDALLTDYSSVGVDYLVVDKPIGYTLDDFEAYRIKRGFVFDDPRCYMPGHHLYEIEDLRVFFHDVANSNDPYKESRKKMRNVAVFESDCYSKEIVDAIGLLQRDKMDL